MRRALTLALAGMVFTLAGCVERRFVIESTPPGAKVYVNNRAIGFTPCDMPFTYYGTYQFTLELDGHQTLVKEENIAAPWYQFPPIDFVAENINPFKVSDIQRLHYDMVPMPRSNLDELRTQAEELRIRGKALPAPTLPVEPTNGRSPTFPVSPRPTLPAATRDQPSNMDRLP